MKAAEELLVEELNLWPQDAWLEGRPVSEVVAVMEAYAKEYALACLQKAAENARMRAENYNKIEIGNGVARVETDLIEISWAYKEVTIDKESITNPQNLL